MSAKQLFSLEAKLALVTGVTHGLLDKIGDSVVARAPLHRLGGDDLKGAIVFPGQRGLTPHHRAHDAH